MITPEELERVGFHYSEDNEGWMLDGADTRFDLHDGVVDWFGQSTNFNGLTIEPIQDISTLLLIWKLITGIQL